MSCRARSEHEICSLLKAFGRSLEGIYIGNECGFTMTKKICHAIGQHCKQLKKLEIEFIAVPLDRIINLLNACESIRALTLCGGEPFSLPDIVYLLQSCPHLCCFEGSTSIGGTIALFEILTTVCELFKRVERFSIGPLNMTRNSAGSLDMIRLDIDTEVPAPILDNFLRACTPLTTLNIGSRASRYLSREAMIKMGTAFGPSMKKLLIYFFTEDPINEELILLFALRCPVLESLMCNSVKLSSSALQQLAVHCPKLTNIDHKCW